LPSGAYIITVPLWHHSTAAPQPITEGNMSSTNLQDKINAILSILGNGSQFVDDEILLGNDDGVDEEKVMLFSHRDYLITAHQGDKFTYWRLIREVNTDDVRWYCGLKSDDEIIPKDIFLAGYYDLVIKIQAPHGSF